MSLPMMLFMLVVALSQPLGGPWVERLGSRKLIMFGAVLGAGGLALTAVADNLWTLMIWRLIAAAGYGIVFAAGQGYVVANTDARNRAWGLAMFVGSVLAASICGPAIGGILADRIGYRMTFVVGAGLALLAAIIAFKMLDARGHRKASGVRSLRLRDVMLVLRNLRFVALVSLGAMPAKIILTGFLYYLAPLYLADLGNSPSATGQIMMLYGLMMVLFTPCAAWLVDRIGRRLLFVCLGGLISSLGVIAISASPSTADDARQHCHPRYRPGNQHHAAIGARSDRLPQGVRGDRPSHGDGFLPAVRANWKRSRPAHRGLSPAGVRLCLFHRGDRLRCRGWMPAPAGHLAHEIGRRANGGRRSRRQIAQAGRWRCQLPGSLAFTLTSLMMLVTPAIRRGSPAVMTRLSPATATPASTALRTATASMSS